MIPRVVIAGTHSGCGKTTIACALMSALTARGLTVQPFKVGPDFIDPSHHTSICNRPSRNLDPYMMSKAGVRKTFCCASEGADIAVIEGVMGMYDGLGGEDLGSTAHVAKLISAPVILTVDVRGMSRSANATAEGYCNFDPEVNFAGVIFNRIGSPSHRAMIEQSLSLKAFGWIPWEKKQEIGSRHLGLQMAHETSGMSRFGEIIEKHCDVDAIIELASSAPDNNCSEKVPGYRETEKIRIGIAHDEAFCFYYQDNLDRLRALGAELIPFSPIRDRLPDVDGLYLGGGYPEIHAENLERSLCRDDIKRAIGDGLPVYAECGGLTYLCESITTEDEFQMVDILPARAIQKDRFQALGYVNATCTGGTTLLPKGLSYRGHEFHYSLVECDSDARFALALSRGRGIRDGHDGLYEHNVLAGYTHAYFTDRFVRSFLNMVKMEKKA